jgi:hypothetical protein
MLVFKSPESKYLIAISYSFFCKYISPTLLYTIETTCLMPEDFLISKDYNVYFIASSNYLESFLFGQYLYKLQTLYTWE